MNFTYGNIYELKFDETGPRPFQLHEVAPVKVTGVDIQDALKRWDESRSSGYVAWYPTIISVTKILDGVNY